MVPGGAPPRLSIRVEGHEMWVGTQMKYLGLHLNGGWTFGEHFAQLAPRMGRVAASLARLLNLGGPDGRARKLYVGTVDRWPCTGPQFGRRLPRSPGGYKAP